MGELALKVSLVMPERLVIFVLLIRRAYSMNIRYNYLSLDGEVRIGVKVLGVEERNSRIVGDEEWLTT